MTSLANVKLLVLDHDGVLTDNYVYLNQDGVETCRYSRADGLGIERVKAAGLMVLVLSSERNPIVAARCLKLNIPHIQGVQNKIEALREYWPNLETAAYVGNDLNDLECLREVRFPFIVQDAEPSLLDALCTFGRVNEFRPATGYWLDQDMQRQVRVTARKGGEGAVREVCEMILAAKAQAAIPMVRIPGQPFTEPITLKYGSGGSSSPVIDLGIMDLSRRPDLVLQDDYYDERPLR